MRTFSRMCRLSSLALLVVVPAFADSGADHQARQSRPVQLGTSGGNELDRTNRFCCSGTLGALVQDGAGQYVLSNNHVLARLNDAAAGEPVTQPGLADNVCLVATADEIATLTRFVPIDFRKNRTNAMDAAIAQAMPGMVSATGDILDIGTVSSGTLASPALGTAVKKSGRTTGLTTGTVTGLNATVSVGYAPRCGANSTKVATFTGQIVFSGMSDEGDSGALIVEDVASCPRGVALLFAGSATATVGTPIDAVLVEFGVTMVGCAAGAPSIENLDLGVRHAIEVQSRATERLLQMPGVAGTSVGVDAGGRAYVQVYLEADDPMLRGAIPAQFEDVPSRVIVSGPFVAQ